jgi:hypothetical protein
LSYVSYGMSLVIETTPKMFRSLFSSFLNSREGNEGKVRSEFDNKENNVVVGSSTLSHDIYI